jgi:hypothetical protein
MVLQATPSTRLTASDVSPLRRGRPVGAEDGDSKAKIRSLAGRREKDFTLWDVVSKIERRYA